MYLVAEWKDMSAPRCNGRWKYEDMKVLSTTDRAPASRATLATSRISMTFMVGLVGVSIQISFIKRKSQNLVKNRKFLKILVKITIFHILSLFSTLSVFGLTAFLTHSTSSILTKLASIPCLLNCLLNNLLVPP